MEGIPEIQNRKPQEIQAAAKCCQEEVAEEKNKKQQKQEEPKAQEPAKREEPVDRYQASGNRKARGGPGATGGPTEGYGAGYGAGAAGGQGGGPGNEILIDKGGTKLTANDAAAIAEIFQKTGKSGMKPEELVEALKAKGIDAYATTVNGKKAIKFANGDVFVDTSGNGVLDSDDKEWQEAVKLLNQKYGMNFNILSGGGGGGGKDQLQALKEGGLEGLFGNNPLLPKTLTNPAYEGSGNSPAAYGQGGAGQNRGEYQNFFSDLDGRLGEVGYKGAKAEELYQKGDLSSTLAEYGVPEPLFPGQKADVTDYINRLFNTAFQISLAKR